MEIYKKKYTQTPVEVKSHIVKTGETKQEISNNKSTLFYKKLSDISYVLYVDVYMNIDCINILYDINENEKHPSFIFYLKL